MVKKIATTWIHSSSGNIKLTSYNDVNDVIDELFKSLCSRYQGNLETSMRGIDFTFDSVQLTYYVYWFSRLDKKEKSNSKSEKNRR